jgi:hypothetical protein
MRLYPSANILVATQESFGRDNRKKFCSRIATGDYDAVIIGQSQFERIPISEKRKLRLIKEQINDFVDGLDSNMSVKQRELARKRIDSRISKLNTTVYKDNVVTFEELGVDRIFIDEAHSYRNLYMTTKMINVAGISNTYAKKSSDLLIKCRYMDELTGGKGIIFATGTPVNNSMTELYTMMRYLQNDELKKRGLGSFDAWASVFGEITNSLELKSTGTGYTVKTRFSKFYNLPELMNMFREVADIQTADMLNLPVPKVNYHTIVAKPTEHQVSMMKELSSRAEALHRGGCSFKVDNSYKITIDGRKIGLDQRLMDNNLPDDEHSKVNMCMRNIYEIWKNTESKRLTQLMFCDFSVPDKDRFNLYDDIKAKLIQRGVPKEEIWYIHDAKSDKGRETLFENVRKGQVRILMGSTRKMGFGTNVQDKLIAIHNLDCPNKPSDDEQRIGRAARRGNDNEEINIYRYVTESTFDSFLYQAIENKQRFVSQIMTSKSPLRSCESADEKVMSYAEIKAICAGDGRIREKMLLDIEVAKLRLYKSDYQSTIYNLEDRLNKTLPKEINQTESLISNYEEDIAQVNSTRTVSADDKMQEFSSMNVLGKVFTGKHDINQAGEAIIKACKDNGHELRKNDIEIGTYRGFKMSLSFSVSNNEYALLLKNKGIHKVELGSSAATNMSKLENALNGISEKLEFEKEHLSSLHNETDYVKSELEKPFIHEEELAIKSARLSKLNIELNLDKLQDVIVEETEEEITEEIDTESSSYDEDIDNKTEAISIAKGIMGKNAYVISAQAGKKYSGEIIAKTEEYAIQRVTENKAVLHEIESLPAESNIKVGAKITLHNQDGITVLKKEKDAPERKEEHER